MTKTTGTILLVDDEAKIRQALAQALREDGHEVVAVGNPREAQRLLTRGSFDVLLVDNLMPELTGLDLIRELVGTTAVADRPQILLMTAHATVESAIGARSTTCRSRSRSTSCWWWSTARSITSGCGRSTATCSASATKSSTSTASSAAASASRR
jgi:CheY-like chemotaxis protein